jgi:hypothetical protein
LAALAVRLVAEFAAERTAGKVDEDGRSRRVVYIPDCELLVYVDPAVIILRSALFLAFSDDSAAVDQLSHCSSLDHIKEFIDGRQNRDCVYWIADEWSAFDAKHTDSAEHSRVKHLMRGSLMGMFIHNVHLVALSSNNETVEQLRARQSNYEEILLNGGLTAVSTPTAKA